MMKLESNYDNNQFIRRYVRETKNCPIKANDFFSSHYGLHY